MTRTIGILLAAGAIAACRGDGDLNRRSQQYDVVQEGSASGVTSTINGPGEPPPVNPKPITGTGAAADTTTNFTLPTPQPGMPQQPDSLAGTLPPPDVSGRIGTTPPQPPHRAPQPQPRVTPRPSEPAPDDTPPSRQAPPPTAEPSRGTSTQPPATDTLTTTAPPTSTTTDTSQPPQDNRQQRPNELPPASSTQPPPPPPTTTDTRGD